MALIQAVAALIQVAGSLAQVAGSLAQVAGSLAHAALFNLLPQACALCASSSRDNKAAYVGTTLFLLAVPLALLSALILWLIRRAR